MYARGGHLLCHDDVIGTRCVSYILYLSRPGQQWVPRLGGALELYATDAAGGAGCRTACSGVDITPDIDMQCPRLVPVPPFHAPGHPRRPDSQGKGPGHWAPQPHRPSHTAPATPPQPHRLGVLEPAASKVGDSTTSDLPGPATAPCVVVPSQWGTLLLFTVQPGVSFHAVAEVLSRGEPRLSVSGWFV